MKMRFLMLGGLLMWTATATAQPRWLDQFLSRYKPPAADPSAVLISPQTPLETLIQAGALPLTVGDLVRLMLDNNPDVIVNRFSPLSNQYFIDSLYRNFEPALRLQVSIERNTSPSANQLVGAAALSRLGGNYSVGFSQTLQSGTSFGVDASIGRSSSNSVFNTFNPSYSGLVRYSFAQPLLRGYGRNINTRQIRIAQNTKASSEIQFERDIIDLVTQAQHLYWDLVFAREDIKVKERSLDLANKTLSDNRRQVEIGTLAQIDVVQAESEVANRREQLVVTSFNSDQFQDRIRKLITRTGNPMLAITPLQPQDTVRRPEPSEVMPVDDAIRYAMENRPELRQLEYELRSRNVDIEFARNQLKPTLDVFASYTQNGIGGTQTIRDGLGPDSRVLSVRKGGLGDAFSQLFSYDYTGYAIGFSLQIPLTNRSAQAEYSRAQTERTAMESRRAALTQVIALEVRNAFTMVGMNKARIEAAEKARELASRRLDAEQRKFQLGASTIRFVLEEQRNLAVAQTSELQSLVNYTKALVDFDRAIGRTLRRNSVEIERHLKVAEGPAPQSQPETEGVRNRNLVSHR